MPAEGVCKYGCDDAVKLHPDGQCQRCLEFEDPPYDAKRRNDFQWVKDFEEAQTLICRQCGSDQFIVAHWNYFTAIKCVKCKWERCIHDG